LSKDSIKVKSEKLTIEYENVHGQEIELQQDGNKTTLNIKTARDKKTKTAILSIRKLREASVKNQENEGLQIWLRLYKYVEEKLKTNKDGVVSRSEFVELCHGDKSKQNLNGQLQIDKRRRPFVYDCLQPEGLSLPGDLIIWKKESKWFYSLVDVGDASSPTPPHM
jgi:hypothetical protein